MTLALDQEPLPSALRQLLQPLVRLALARGLPYAALDELLRATLDRAAEAALCLIEQGADTAMNRFNN